MEFNTNNKLHNHIRGRTYHKSTPTSPIKSTRNSSLSTLIPVDNTPPKPTTIAPTATTAVTVETSLQATSHAAHQATSPPSTGLLTSHPVSPPPTYRAISPNPSTYRANSPNAISHPYLTMQDLYKRYGNRKSMHLAFKLASSISSYLII